MRKKLKSSRGETLVEVLAAILIGALSIALLFTAVMASVSMDKTARTVDKNFTESLNKAEEQKDKVTDTSIVPTGTNVTVKSTTGPGPAVTVPVDFYGGEGAISYKLSP